MNLSDEITFRKPDARIIFLHHSTGLNVWKGSKMNSRFLLNKRKYDVPRHLNRYNKENNLKYSIKERAFPKGNPYPWNNYPFDYYNIWVKHAGAEPFMEEPTLEMLTKDYDLIIFKFCFPVSKIMPDDENPDVNSDKKTLANYELQMEALKRKMHEFPDTKFLVWTGAALTEAQTNEEEAGRAREFSRWMKEVWNEQNDNIEIFDFRELETSGGLYLKPEHAASKTDSHPNRKISTLAAKAFVEKILSVLNSPK